MASNSECEFRKIDNALAQYYKHLNIPNYYDSNSNGLFLNYIIDEELDDLCLPIEKELGDPSDPNDCAYSWMNNQNIFPIPSYVQIPCDKQDAFIYYILQYCYKHSDAPSDEYIKQIIVPKCNGTVHKTCTLLPRNNVSLSEVEEDEHKHISSDDNSNSSGYTSGIEDSQTQSIIAVNVTGNAIDVDPFNDSNSIKNKTERFVQAFDNIEYNTNINDINIAIVNKYTNGNKALNELIMISLANRIPIAQFMVDRYFECAFKYNLTINEFMAKSKCLSMLSHNSTPWKLIRRHLTQYLRHCYLPISAGIATNDMDESDNDEKDITLDNNCEQIAARHNMGRILYYTSVIHENLYILNKVCQTDVIFLPQLLLGVNKYFDELGVKYEKFKCEKGMKQMMRHFNETLGNKSTWKRCIILIMENNNDTVYIFSPLTHNSLPPEIYNYTEFPWISNTKSDILPHVSPNNYDALCLSFHKHRYHNNTIAERVYLSYGMYGCRVFKYNLVDILEPFCIKKEEHPMIDWDEEINNREFKDNEYDLFVDAVFSDYI